MLSATNSAKSIPKAETEKHRTGGPDTSDTDLALVKACCNSSDQERVRGFPARSSVNNSGQEMSLEINHS